MSAVTNILFLYSFQETALLLIKAREWGSDREEVRVLRDHASWWLTDDTGTTRATYGSFGLRRALHWWNWYWRPKIKQSEEDRSYIHESVSVHGQPAPKIL